MKVPGQWSRRPTGLYVPNTYTDNAVPQSTADPTRQRESPFRRMPEWLMAFTAVISTIFAFSSVNIALNAFKTQSLAVHQERETREMESASRVTWWPDIEEYGTVKVRNATSGQLFRSTFVFLQSEKRPVFLVLPSIPVCNTLTLRPIDSEFERLRLTERVPDLLVFQDGAGSWTRTISGTLRRTEPGEFATEENGLVTLARGDDRPNLYTRIEGCA